MISSVEMVLWAIHHATTLLFGVFASAALCRIEWLNAAVVERLARLDVIYGVAGAVMIGSGLARFHCRRFEAPWGREHRMIAFPAPGILPPECTIG